MANGIKKEAVVKKRKKRGNGEGGVWMVSEGVWRGRLCVGKNPLTGKPLFLPTVSGIDDIEVKRKLAAQRTDFDRGELKIKNDVTVDDLANVWLEKEIRRNSVPGSYNAYESQFRLHITPVFGKMKLHELTKDIIEEGYYLHFAKKTTNQGGKNDSYSQTTVKTISSRFKACLAYGVDQGLLLKNPHNKVVVAKVNLRPAKVVEAYSIKDQTILIEHCKKNPSAFAFLFMFFTGIRIGEVFALAWDCIDFEGKKVVIKRKLVEELHKKPKVKESLKSKAGYRELKLNSQLLELLKKIKEDQSMELNHLNLVFPATNFAYKTSSNFRDLWTTESLIAGVDYKSPHHIRHTFATRLIERGVDIKTVSLLMGHKDIKTTLQTYVHVLSAHKNSSMDVLNELW